MSNRRHLLVGAAAAALSGLPRAQSDGPRENLRIVCGFPAGGTADTVARRLSDGATPTLARTSLVETKTGAGGQIAAQFVKSAPTDGSTLLLTPLTILCTYPHTFAKLPYDSLNDFVAVGAGASFEYAVGVGPQVPPTVKNIADLMKWCKLAPTHASFGSPASGAAPHFIGVLIGKSAGVDMTHVAYRGTPPAILDMVGGQIPIVIGPLGEFLQYAKDGRCRIVATSGVHRSRFAHEVATLKEQGHPEVTFDEWFAFFAPTGIPATAIGRTNAQIANALTKPSVATTSRPWA